MSEFIGSRISLVSRSDIRYVGILHEINSETSTVALENVTSFGTEGRKENPEDEIAPSDSNYEYIVFRGSDVKDLRIEEAPAVKENKPPQPPNDPAILGVSGARSTVTQIRAPPAQVNTQPAQVQAQARVVREVPLQGRPPSGTTSGPSSSDIPAGPPAGPPTGLPSGPSPSTTSGPPAGPPTGPPAGPPSASLSGPPTGPIMGPPHFAQHGQYPQQFYPPPPGQWGRGGPPMPGPGYHGMPYGVPPPWYPPPGQGYPHANMYPYMPVPGPPVHQFPQAPKPVPIGGGQNKQQVPGELSADKPVEPKSLAKPIVNVPITANKSVTPPIGTKSPVVAKSPVTSKPEVGDVAIVQAQPSAPKVSAPLVAQKTPTGPKSTKIMPAVPLQSPVLVKTTPTTSSGKTTKDATAAPKTTVARTAIDDATQAATAAVAAAMAKLAPIGGQQTNGSNVDNLAKKVNNMKMTEPVRTPRQPRGDGFAVGRGRGRGGHANGTAKFEVPAADFDFESANAKFSKQDLVKEATAGSPLAEVPPRAIEENINGSVKPSSPASYNKSSSFFDDLSSEIKDRSEGGDRPGGRVWRGEEQKKNLETFGQGSVDNGYRGGYRGRGRGRGGVRGRGYGGNGQQGVRGRGGYRGRVNSQTVEQ